MSPRPYLHADKQRVKELTDKITAVVLGYSPEEIVTASALICGVMIAQNPEQAADQRLLSECFIEMESVCKFLRGEK